MSDESEAGRRVLLVDLVEWAQAVAELKSRLARLPWDVEQPLVNVERRHVEAAVDRVRLNRATLADLVEWADALECRDDIACTDVARDMLHVLANPTLFAITDLVDVERELAARST